MNLNRGRGGLCQQMEAGQADITVCLLFETEGEQMEFLSNLHTHSCFSDGRDTPEEIVREALRKGFISLGFSDHSPTPYFSDCNMPEERTEAYRREIRRLQKRYAGQIAIFLGIEQDANSAPAPRQLYDYRIGSVHDLLGPDGQVYTVDWDLPHFEDGLRELSGGDIRDFCGRYYAAYRQMLQTHRPEIAGHMDLLKKLNQEGRFFREEDTWYLEMAEQTLEAVRRTGAVLEVNTGGIARGGCREPYPSAHLLQIACQKGIPVTLSADAHRKEDLDFYFRESIAILRQVGYRQVKRWETDGWTDVSLNSISG